MGRLPAKHVYGPNGEKDAVPRVDAPKPLLLGDQPTRLRVTGFREGGQVVNVWLDCWPDGTVSWRPA